MNFWKKPPFWILPALFINHPKSDLSPTKEHPSRNIHAKFHQIPQRRFPWKCKKHSRIFFLYTTGNIRSAIYDARAGWRCVGWKLNVCFFRVERGASEARCPIEAEFGQFRSSLPPSSPNCALLMFFCICLFLYLFSFYYSTPLVYLYLNRICYKLNFFI